MFPQGGGGMLTAGIDLHIIFGIIKFKHNVEISNKDRLWAENPPKLQLLE